MAVNCQVQGRSLSIVLGGVGGEAPRWLDVLSVKVLVEKRLAGEMF